MSSREFRALESFNGAYLYRYKSPGNMAHIREVILEHQLFFSAPRDFNDPLDSRPKIVLEDPKGIWPFLARVYRRNNHHKDPFWMEEELRLYEQFALAEGPKFMIQQVIEFFVEPMASEHRICCFATRPNSDYLWNHYALGSSGCCFEFHNDGPIVGGVSVTRKVKYGDQYVLDMSKPDDVSAAYLFHKTVRYAEEEEVRVLLVPRGRDHIQEFHPSRLNRIILGRNIKPGNRRVVEKWCRLREPELEIAEQGRDDQDNAA